MRSRLMRISLLLACVLAVLGYMLVPRTWSEPPTDSTPPIPDLPSASSTATASTTYDAEAVTIVTTRNDRRRVDRATPAARAARMSEPRVSGRSTLGGLIEGAQLHPGKALNLLHSDFDGVIADLRSEGGGDAASGDLARLYRTQIAAISDGTEASLRQLECGRQLCAAEIVLPIPTRGPDPFSLAVIGDLLPRDARVETSYADQDLLVRRFIFSIDPDVTSLVNTRRP